MSRYATRDARLSRLATAIDGASPDDFAVRNELMAETDAIAKNTWRVSDQTYEFVTADWLAGSLAGGDLRQQIDLDPVLRATHSTTQLTDAHVSSIQTLTLPAFGEPVTGYLEQVKQALGNDSVVFEEIVHAAHRRWMFGAGSGIEHPFDDVGVVHPVRLETLFDKPASTHNPDPERWMLSLRVIPDEASIVRDPHYLGKDEAKALTAFWQSVKQAGAVNAAWLDGPSVEVAWTLLADQITPSRAAYLIGSIPVVVDGDEIRIEPPADLPEFGEPNRVVHMPERLQIIAELNVEFEGSFIAGIGSLPESATQTIDVEALTFPFPKRPEDAKAAWWVDFQEARAVGLGAMVMLRTGLEPGMIKALYVIGIGDQSPAETVNEQIESGEFALLPIGLATNAIPSRGEARVEEGDPNWRRIAKSRLARRLGDPGDGIGQPALNAYSVLTGKAAVPAAFPGAWRDGDVGYSQTMICAMWPALWMGWAALWKFGPNGFRLLNQMIAHLFPEGPFQPARVGDQPYGLLPVTSLDGWEPDPSFDIEVMAAHPVLKEAADVLADMRDYVAARVEGKTVVGEHSGVFMEMLGQPALSPDYVYRKFAPINAQLGYLNLDTAGLESAIAETLKAYDIIISRYNVLPFMPNVAGGYWIPLDLPLVKPTRTMFLHQGERSERRRIAVSRFLQHIYAMSGSLPGTATLEHFFTDFGIVEEDGEFLTSTLPDSLYVRMLIGSAQIVTLLRQSGPTEPAQITLLDTHEALAPTVANLADDERWWQSHPDPISGQRIFTVAIPADQLAKLERAFRSVLDTAAHRLDPWVAALALPRLLRSSSSERQLYRSGVYGWVDGPFLGEPGPTPAGLLHTPSHSQTLAALILRDRFIASQPGNMLSEQDLNPWQMDITAAKARLAEEIADEVRLGFHIYEVIGRMVEQIIDDHQKVRATRISADYAMRPDRKDPNEVCNGMLVLNDLKANALKPPLDTLSNDQETAISNISDALDTYSDLLMTDGMMQLINRQPDRAAETMDAAAGFARPPSFQFLQTPPSGYMLETVVVSVLPFVTAADAGDVEHPVWLADGSVAAFINGRFPGAWTWRAFDLETGSLLGQMTLSELQLSPVDALVIPAGFFEQMLCTKLSVATARIEHPAQHEQSQRTVAALGSRPLIGRDLIVEQSLQAAADQAVFAELSQRFAALHAQCIRARDGLLAANSDQVRTALLRRALAWGAAPASDPPDRDGLLSALLGLPAPADATSLSKLCERAAEVLTERLKLAPDPAEFVSSEAIGAPLTEYADLRAAGMPDGVQSLAIAIRSLASPNAVLAVLGAWPTSSLKSDGGVITTNPDTGLDTSWLTVTAAVRSNLARLEAVQLESINRLAAWTSSPGDPWRTGSNAAVQKNLLRRKEAVTGFDMSRFVVTYGLPTAWQDQRAAVGLIDAFSEALPMPQRSTEAAFGFNAPASRPQQAILLAVPPKPRQFIDEDLLFKIVRETRALTLTRAARIEDFGELQSVLPTSLLFSNGPLRVPLDPWPLFEAGVS